jgi:hypothetical protein
VFGPERIKVPVPVLVIPPELEIAPEKVVFVLLTLNVLVPVPRATVPSKIRSLVPAKLKLIPDPPKAIAFEIVRVVLSVLWMKLPLEVPLFLTVNVPVPSGPLVMLPGPPTELLPMLITPAALCVEELPQIVPPL